MSNTWISNIKDQILEKERDNPCTYKERGKENYADAVDYWLISKFENSVPTDQ